MESHDSRDTNVRLRH